MGFQHFSLINCMSDDDAPLNELLMELENDLVEVDFGETKTPVKETPKITESNMEDVLMDRLGGLITTLETGSNVLSERLKAGDTYESTVIGLSQLTGNLLNVVKVLDNRKGVKEKQRHDVEMQKTSHENRKSEIELRAKLQPEKIGNNNNITQNNFNGFVGNTESFFEQALKVMDKKEPEEIKVIEAVECDVEEDD